MAGVSTLVALISIALSLAAPVAVERALVSDIVAADAQLSAESVRGMGGMFAMLQGFGGIEGLEPILAATLADTVTSLGPAAEELRARSRDSVVTVAIDRSTVVLVAPDGTARVESVDLTEVGKPVVAVRELFALSGEVGGGAGLFADMFDAASATMSMPDGGPAAHLGDMFGDAAAGGPPLDRLGALLDSEIGRGAGPGFGPAGMAGVADGSSVPGALDGGLTYGVRRIDGVSYLVGAPLDGVARSVDRVRQWLRWSVPITVLLAGLVTWLLAGRALRPVRAITEQAARIGAGTLHERVPVPPTGDEIATLAVTMNEMLGRLQAHDHRHRRFVSDASHELRSPVAVLRTAADVALQPGSNVDATELAQRVRAESDRMATMISDLLTLARYDEGGPGPTAEVDLDDVLLEEAARPRRVPVDVRAVSGGRVRGRAPELRRMVTHLLDNAARHARGSVWVSLGCSGQLVQLAVEDDGVGIPVEQRRAIFERFVRLDAARTRDAGGAGLGLAVVSSIVEGLGGHVTVDDSPHGGARFVVTLSAAN
ncbi:MAG: ATP-binding protein [Acidimicrobiales bacterium]